MYDPQLFYVLEVFDASLLPYDLAAVIMYGKDTILTMGRSRMIYRVDGTM